MADPGALSLVSCRSYCATNVLQLYASLTKYAQLQGVAYAFIEDSNGKIIANTIRPLPTELVETSTADERKQVGTRVVTLQGKSVYETRVPILEGQLGAAHLGIWAEDVKKEINTIRLTFVAVMVLLLLVAVALSIFLVRAIIVSFGAGTRLPREISRPNQLKAAIKNRVAS